MSASGRVAVAVGSGLTLLAISLIVTLSKPPLVTAGTNAIPIRATFQTRHALSTCQPGEVLPRDTSAVRLSISANLGPRVTVQIRSGSQTVTQGSRPAGWGTTDTVTVPVSPLAQTVRGAVTCVHLGPSIEPVEVSGSTAPRLQGQSRYPASRVRIEYLRPGPGSWFSMAVLVARHMGLGHAPSGTWTVLLLAAMMLVVVGVSVAMLTASHTSPIHAAWACALVACLSAASWSLITPPFQLPDEPSHFAYAQQLAETASLPTSSEATFSPEEMLALGALRHAQVRWHPEVHTISSVAEQRQLEHTLAQSVGRGGSGAAGVAASEPPLYYLLETIPYYVGSSGNVLDRLELMRLLSALFSGLTALFTYLFVREALPRAPWAWSIGGSGVALTPLLGFTSGGVTPDAMLFAVSAAVFYLLARAFRRGLTPRLATAIGVVTAVGFLTKLNFLGLAPGVILGLLVLTLRAARTSRRVAFRSFGIAIAIAMSPALLYIVINLLSHHRGLGLLSRALGDTGEQGAIGKELSYIWQFFLPRLPGMNDYFPGISPTREIWFDRSVGLYGWFDVSFPPWVSTLALLPATLIGLLCARTLVTCRAALGHRGTEILVYAAMSAGVMILIASDSYLGLADQVAGGYSEPRYLLPMLPLLGTLYALAARGAGRRWGPPVGALIVLLLLGHDIFSQLQVIARYYG